MTTTLYGVDIFSKGLEESTEGKKIKKCADEVRRRINKDITLQELAEVLRDRFACAGLKCSDCKIREMETKLFGHLEASCGAVGRAIGLVVAEMILTAPKIQITPCISSKVSCKACKNFRGVLGCKLIGCKLHGSWTPTKDDYCSKFEALEE